MLKLRVVLSFSLAVVAVILSFDNVSAQGPMVNEFSYSGSGDIHDAGDLPSMTQSPSTPHEAAPTGSSVETPTSHTPAPTTKSPTTSSSSSAGGGTVPRWGVCDDDTSCEVGTFCKSLNSISLCYPEW